MLSTLSGMYDAWARKPTPLSLHGKDALAVTFEHLADKVFFSWTAQELAWAQLAGTAFRTAILAGPLHKRISAAVKPGPATFWFNTPSYMRKELLLQHLSSLKLSGIELNLCGCDRNLYYGHPYHSYEALRDFPMVQRFVLGRLDIDEVPLDMVWQSKKIPKTRVIGAWTSQGPGLWQIVKSNPLADAISKSPRGIFFNMYHYKQTSNVFQKLMCDFAPTHVPTLQVLKFEGIHYYSTMTYPVVFIGYSFALAKWMFSWLFLNPQVKVVRFHEPFDEEEEPFLRVHGMSVVEGTERFEMRCAWQDLYNLVIERGIDMMQQAPA